MNRNNWLNGVTVNLLQWLMCLLWGAQFTGFLFHSNQHRDINTAEYPQTAESLF